MHHKRQKIKKIKQEDNSGMVQVQTKKEGVLSITAIRPPVCPMAQLLRL